MRPTEAQRAHPEDPDGYDGVELKSRVENAHPLPFCHPLLGSGRQKFSQRILSSRGEIARLVAWYSR